MSLAANWGATAHEQGMALACDELLATAPLRLHRAVSVQAEPRLVFHWLCQLKQAPYSYDLLDNLGRRSPREMTPGGERLEVGQRFMSIFTLASFTPDEQLTLRARRTVVTYAALGEGHGTRLIARVLLEPPGGPLLGALAGRALALGDLLMMRKQLLTLKALSERDAARAGDWSRRAGP
jgi:hypothetical protein